MKSAGVQDALGKKRFELFYKRLGFVTVLQICVLLDFETCSIDRLQNCAIISRWQRVISPPPALEYSRSFPLIELQLNIALFGIPSIFVGIFLLLALHALSRVLAEGTAYQAKEVQKVSVVKDGT